MGRTSDIEAFAKMLEGGPAGSVPASVAALGHTVSALRGLPVPATPSGLAGGGVALLARPSGTRIAATHAATHAATTAGTRIASTPGMTAKVATGASKFAAAKATVFGIVTAHLVPVVAGTAVLAVGITGVAVGASRSLPGDPLYSLKRGTEAVRSATATTRVGAAERQLDLATTRLHEALALQARGGTPAQLAAELHEWLTDVNSAVQVLGPLAGTPAIRGKLAAFAATDAASLTEFPAATVAPATAAVAQLTALLTGTVEHLPVLAKPGTTAKSHPAGIPSIAGMPRHQATPAAQLPSVVHLPSALPSVTIKLPVAKLPVAKQPVIAAPSVVPSAPTAVLPSVAVPTVSLPPVVLPTIPVPTVSDVTTLLQGLAPKH